MGRPRKIGFTKNQKINYLIILREVEPIKKGTRKVECRCTYLDCNSIKVLNLYDVLKSKVMSCGCLKKDILVKESTRHGYREHPLYDVYRNIKRRCYNKEYHQYADYGGRGITMCKSWRKNNGIGFQEFLNWCLSLPKSKQWKKGLQIDRKDNNGNYEPSNCRFVTRLVNANNKRPYKKRVL